MQKAKNEPKDDLRAVKETVSLNKKREPIKIKEEETFAQCAVQDKLNRENKAKTKAKVKNEDSDDDIPLVFFLLFFPSLLQCMKTYTIIRL